MVQAKPDNYEISVKFDDYPWPIKAGNKVMSHQIETAKFALCNKNCYVLNDMGTGKTLSVLWAADFLMRNQAIKRVLIVSPLSGMRATWVRDLVLNIPNRRYGVAHGNKERRVAVIRSNADFVIINHDGIKIVQEEIIRAQFDLFIIDELTAYKNYSADRTKAAERIARSIGPVWGLTGIPTPNSPIEAYGQAKVVNPKNPFLPKFFTQYRDLTMTKINQFIWISKPGANDLVHKVLQPAIRFTRDQCVDLPPCVKDTRFIEMTAQQKAMYETMRTKLLIEYKDGTISAVNAAVKLMKLTQIAAGSVKDDDGNTIYLDATNRLNELMSILEETPQGKLVVFAAFRADIERIVEFFEKKKLNQKSVRVFKIYGSTPHGQRAEAIRDFQDGDLNVLVIQPQSTAHSVTLTAANTVVWYSLIPSNEYYTQANHRIIRIGQLRGQLIIHLVGSAAETRLVKLLDNKGEQSDNLLQSFEYLLSPELPEEDLSLN